MSFFVSLFGRKTGYYNQHGLKFILIFGHYYSLKMPHKVEGILFIGRHLFPAFWWISLRDCDSGGRFHGGFPAITWNYWDLLRKEKEWDNASDGPAYSHRISLIQFIKSPNWKRY